jgi:hypothetical protein
MLDFCVRKSGTWLYTLGGVYSKNHKTLNKLNSEIKMFGYTHLYLGHGNDKSECSPSLLKSWVCWFRYNSLISVVCPPLLDIWRVSHRKESHEIFTAQLPEVLPLRVVCGEMYVRNMIKGFEILIWFPCGLCTEDIKWTNSESAFSYTQIFSPKIPDFSEVDVHERQSNLCFLQIKQSPIVFTNVKSSVFLRIVSSFETLQHYTSLQHLHKAFDAKKDASPKKMFIEFGCNLSFWVPPFKRPL